MKRLARRLRALPADEAGATLVTTAMLLTVLLGFVGLGLDLGVAVAGRRTTQNAADAAALSGAVTLAGGGKAPDATGAAKAVSAQYGLADSPGAHVTVAVHTPPVAGLHVGDPSAVEVVITRPGVGFFSTLFVKTVQPISARAVAVAGRPATCLLTLDPAAVGAITVNGTATINMPNCALYANSASTAGAIILNGDLTINVTGVDAVGHVLMNGTVVANANDNSPAMPDPYAGTQPPSFSPNSCNATNPLLTNQTKTFNAVGSTPFVFCNGLTLNGGAKVTFGPGVYVINGGTFLANGSGNVINANGATFIFENGANLIFNGSVQGALSAPTAGATAGLLFFAPSGNGGQIILNGDPKATFEGAIYAPDELLTLNGAVNAPNGGCAEIITGKLTVNGSVQLDNKCAGTGVKAIGGRSRLVE